MTDLDSQTRPCHYCGQSVSVGSYRCPHCGRSLAAAEQQQWEASEPSSESYEDSEERAGIQIPTSVVTAGLFLAAFAIVAAALYGFFPDRSARRKSDELPAIFGKSVRKPAPERAKKPESGATSYIRIHDDSDSPAEGAAASEVKPVETENGSARDERIQRVADRLFEELRREKALKPYTIHLKSGGEIEGDIVDESDDRLTIKVGGMTAIIARESIERIERPSSEAPEMKTTALAHATEIVDRGLVRDGKDWVTPEEKARRSKNVKPRKRPGRPEPRAEKTSDTAEAKPDSDDFKSKTDKEKLESLLALVRKKKVLDADFFGGTLHIEDNTGDQPNGEESSFVSFEAQAEGLDVSQVFAYLKLDGKASGDCNADVEADFDQSDPSTLNGAAQVTCEKMTIPPIDLTMILTPRSERAALDFAASAEDGTVVIQRLRLIGTAYSIAGTATIRLADKPEKSSIEGSFAVVFNEPPTFTDEGASAQVAQYMLYALAGSGSEILVKLSGLLLDPNVELTADTPIGSIAWNLD